MIEGLQERIVNNKTTGKAFGRQSGMFWIPNLAGKGSPREFARVQLDFRTFYGEIT